MSLATRLVLLVLLAIAPLVAIDVFNQQRIRQSSEKEIERVSLARARSVAEQLAQTIRGVEQLLLAVAESPSVRGRDERACGRYLRAVQTRSGMMTNIWAVGADGRVFCSAAPLTALLDVNDRRYFRDALATGGLAIGDVTIGRIVGNQVIQFAYPIHGDAGQRDGVVAAALPLSGVAHQISTNPPPPRSRITVLDRNGVIVAQSPDNSRAGAPASGRLRELLATPGAATTRWTTDDARNAFVGQTPVGDGSLGLRVVVELASDEMLRPLDDAMWRGATVLLLGVCASLLAAGLISRNAISRPIARLDEVVRRWESGDFSARTGVRDRSEVGRLGRAFDRMADALQQRELERAQAEVELRRASEAARRANDSKTQFLASASHDLRQPLQSLELAVAVLTAQWPDGRDRVVVDRMKRAVASLSSLLNSLLDVSQIDTGVITPHWSDFPIRETLQALEAEFTSIAEHKQLELRVEPCDAWVRSDATQLGRMSRNLVSNAIKYTPAGGSVTVRCVPRGASLLVSVIDNGIGIAPEQQGVIFREFVQLENPERDRTKGLGLGLAIVERLSRLLDHPIAVQSSPGGGSTFTITVPLARARPIATTEPSLAPTPDLRVLLVEDDALVGELMAELLRDWRARVRLARSAGEAIDALRSGGERFDIVISDYRLPGDDGLAVLRAAAQHQPHARCVLVTADETGLGEARADAIAVLRKPVRAEDLAVLLRQGS